MIFHLEAEALDTLFSALKNQGYTLVGPTLQDGAIVYDQLTTSADLPRGWTDRQDGGSYRLEQRKDGAYFGYAVGPHSWKKYLHPARRKLWSARRSGNSFEVHKNTEPPEKLAFIGVRACELKAMTIQDRVFLDGNFQDESYKGRRENSFVVALNCSKAGDTCFCVSMAAGPAVESGYDLAMTEILEAGRHFFLLEAGSPVGTKILSGLDLPEAAAAEIAAGKKVVAATAAHMGRSMDTSGIKELFYQNYDHPRWEQVADRCLTCANCTMVCPTCFCTTVEDLTDLTGEHTERWQNWDSCFTMDFSFLNGAGSVRHSTKARYRQWLSHKLATWIDQFGSSGCVGCGRCITWCPVGIDLTEEVAALREKSP